MIKTNFQLRPVTVLLAVLLPAACTDANNKFVFDATPVDAGKSEAAAPDTLKSADAAPDVTIQPLDTALPDSPTVLIDAGSVAEVAGVADTAPEAAIQPTVDAARLDSPVDSLEARAPGPSDAGVSETFIVGASDSADSATPSGEDVAQADADTD